MYNVYEIDVRRSGSGAVTAFCFGLIAAVNAGVTDQMTFPPKVVEGMHTSYTLDDGADPSFSGFKLATAQITLADELDAFWGAIRDGSVFHVSEATSTRLDKLLQVRPDLADFI